MVKATASSHSSSLRLLVASAFLHAVRILGDACDRFREFCVDGVELNKERIQRNLEQSLMLVTALKQPLGYDQAAKIAKTAHHNGTTLREEALKLGVTEEQFDGWVRPERMTHPHDK